MIQAYRRKRVITHYTFPQSRSTLVWAQAGAKLSCLRESRCGFEGESVHEQVAGAKVCLLEQGRHQQLCSLSPTCPTMRPYQQEPPQRRMHWPVDPCSPVCQALHHCTEWRRMAPGQCWADLLARWHLATSSPALTLWWTGGRCLSSQS